jgi:excisionase family DNA binding protein
MPKNANGPGARRLLTIEETAARIGQHRGTVYRKVSTGTLPAVRLGAGHAALRVPADELERWLKERRVSRH